MYKLNLCKILVSCLKSCPYFWLSGTLVHRTPKRQIFQLTWRWSIGLMLNTSKDVSFISQSQCHCYLRVTINKETNLAFGTMLLPLGALHTCFLFHLKMKHLPLHVCLSLAFRLSRQLRPWTGITFVGPKYALLALEKGMYSYSSNLQHRKDDE